MGRPPKHPSGAARPITLALSPEHLTKFDRLRRHGESRSEFLTRILDRIPE